MDRNKIADILVVPTVHIAGTAKETLLEDFATAKEAIEIALRAHEKMAPHTRDYIGPGLYEVAIAQHKDRHDRLTIVQMEIEHIALMVSQ